MPRGLRAGVGRGLRALVCGSAAAGLLVIAGCAGGVAERSRGESVGNQGGSGELVFDSPDMTQALAGWDPTEGWEYARRDESMNIQTAAAVTASDEWPEPSRPDLDDWRMIWFSRRPEAFTYFGSGPGRAPYYRSYAPAYYRPYR